MTGFALLTLVSLYALTDSLREEPDVIALCLMVLAGAIAAALISRMNALAPLRSDQIEFDDTALRFVSDSTAYDGAVNIIANRPRVGDAAEYAARELIQRDVNPVPRAADVLFLEIDVVNAFHFSQVLRVRGIRVDEHRILRADSPAAAPAIATILLTLRDQTGIRPHCYFAWPDGSNVLHLLRYLLLGRGYTGPVTRQIIHKIEGDATRRPSIHVGG
jgi:hypothetical protein